MKKIIINGTDHSQHSTSRLVLCEDKTLVSINSESEFDERETTVVVIPDWLYAAIEKAAEEQVGNPNVIVSS